VKHLLDIVGVPQKVLKPQAQVNSESQQNTTTTRTSYADATVATNSTSRRTSSTIAKALPEEAKQLVSGE
jgi:hypothetical protein